MKIRVVNAEHRFTIPLPNWLLFNSVTAAMCTSVSNRYLPEEQITMFEGLSSADLKRLFAEIRKCRRYLNGEPLVYVRSSNGDVVEIYL